ncbi:hypothetical protein [Ralstonia pseudosolanacearum]|uniref:Uncharacterized protein n=1 Tax=Ralstonia solanacearum TaxID=305 RepID=A0ABY6N970_RALSL|nr:hypothetical protein [Ralstonia sp. RS650]UZF13810.1 hypothetical protein LH706_12215 [Ralstonia solanacearum]UZF28874.1 hypothetical protein LGV82_11850 [Ralstonia sp. RS650]
MKRQAFRYESAGQMTEAETWDACVAQLIGPALTPADRDQRQRNAFQLAAAALRAAGADDLAAQAQQRTAV